MHCAVVSSALELSYFSTLYIYINTYIYRFLTCLGVDFSFCVDLACVCLDLLLCLSWLEASESFDSLSCRAE